MSGMFGGRAAVPEVKPVEVITITQPAPMYHPPLPESLVPSEVEWTVLNPSVMREYIDNYDEGNAPAMAYYGFRLTAIIQMQVILRVKVITRC